MMNHPETGERAFVDMMHDFVKTYYHQNASTEDFQRMVEKHMTPGMNLDGNGRMDWFFNEWVYGTKAPRYRLDYSVAEEAGQVILKGTITQSDVSSKFKMPVPLYLEFDGRPIQLGRVALTGNSSSQEFLSPYRSARNAC
jgi:aminopeptidase N